MIVCARVQFRYTSEFQDEHTRAVALRGSSRFQPRAFNESKWYFPPALQLSQHGKYLLFDDAYERAATIGFRCRPRYNYQLCFPIKLPTDSPGRRRCAADVSSDDDVADE